jgi:hypothetical protein
MSLCVIDQRAGPYIILFEGRSGADLHALLNPTLYGGEACDSRPEHFKSWERGPGIHWTGGWTGLNTVVRRKISRPAGNRSRFYGIPVRGLGTIARLSISYEISAVLSGRHYVIFENHWPKRLCSVFVQEACACKVVQFICLSLANKNPLQLPTRFMVQEKTAILTE